MQSKPAKRRARRKEARPAEIIEAGLALFAERGFAATKLEEVATAAGIGKGTIYLYFPSKEDLFRAAVRQAVLPNLDAAEALIASHTGSAADLLRMLAGAFAGILAGNVSAIPKLVIAEAGNFPGLAQFYADTVIKRGRALLAGVIRRGVERGEFRPIDPETAVPLFFSPFLMMALWKHSLARQTDVTFDPPAVLDLHLDVLLRGLAAEDRK